MKIEVWLDSGANIHSKRKTVIDTEEVFGFDDEEWSAFSEEEKESMLYDVAAEKLDWGWKEL